jgi:hypothetical protein
MLRPVRGKYEAWPVREVAWDLARLARVPVGWHPAAVRRDETVTLTLDEMPFREGLDRLARAAGFTGYITERPGAVWLLKGTPPAHTAECTWTAVEVRSYDTASLERAHGFSGTLLVHMVKSRVAPHLWEDPFSAVGYAAARKRLLVVHNAGVQRAVATLLERLARRGRGGLRE